VLIDFNACANLVRLDKLFGEEIREQDEYGVLRPYTYDRGRKVRSSPPPPRFRLPRQPRCALIRQ